MAAVGSFVQARSLGGSWLVRIDDADKPRTVEGASGRILRTLERLELFWDEEVVYQSQRAKYYDDALGLLAGRQVTFDCACTRKELGGGVYPGTCRNGIPRGRRARSVRVKATNHPIRFVDGLQGKVEQELLREVGDFVIFRGDGQTAYHLATVVDDAEQGITEVVRGSDLLDSTPRQIYLQRLLAFTTPVYLHLPLAVNDNGQKLSKQTHAPALDNKRLGDEAYRALVFLGQSPPGELRGESLERLWAWAIANWDIQRVPAAG